MEGNLQRFREQIINLNNSDEFKQLSRYYKKKSFFNILGISRKETIHSYFLHWMFSPGESHELGEYAIRRLLELIVLVKNKLQFINGQLQFPEDIEDIIICGGYTLDRIECERERTTSQGDRIDLFLSFDFHGEQIDKTLNIILENKVKSKEGKEQTTRYYNYGESLNGETIYLFLSPLTNSDYERLTHPICECKQFVGLNYQYLVDYVLEPCLSECAVSDAKVFIEEYLRTLSQPSLQFDDLDGGEIIMAVNSRERDLLLSFWENNKDLLTAALNALADNPELEQEERDRIRESLQAVNKIGNLTEEIRKWIRSLLDEAKMRGDEYIDIVAGDIVRAKLQSNYKKSAQVCSAMKSLMRERDEVLPGGPESGLGSRQTIRYYLQEQ